VVRCSTSPTSAPWTTLTNEENHALLRSSRPLVDLPVSLPGIMEKK